MARAETVGFAPIDARKAAETPKGGVLRRAWKRFEAGQMAKAERVIQEVTGKPAKEVRADMARKIGAAR